MSVLQKTKKRHKLDSWKEISDYLNRDVRTVQRWEARLGLPIHRLDSSPRSRVFSFTDEIDRWMDKSPRLSSKKNNSKNLKRPIPKMALAAILITITAAGIVWVVNAHKNTGVFSREPVDFRLSASRLTVLNLKGRPIWSYDFNVDNLECEDHYKIRFQQKSQFDFSFYLPCLMFRDINGDGTQETLFAMQTTDNSQDNRLICFDHKGNIFWEYNIGRPVDDKPERSFSGPIISGIDTIDIDGNGTLEIFILANHKADFSGLAVFLNGAGEKIGAYKNSGHLEDYALEDIDKDGINELLLTGVNTDWDQPCLVVLDHTCLNGESPQPNSEGGETKDLSCPGKYYILMPILAVRTICGAHNGVKKISLSENPDQMLTLSDLVEYTFNASLELTDVSFSYRFLMEYQGMRRDGKVDRNPSALKEALLAEGALYYLQPRTWSKIPSTARPVPSL